MIIASFLESDYLGMSLKVKMAWDLMLDVSSLQTWLFINKHLGFRIKERMDAFLRSCVEFLLHIRI